MKKSLLLALAVSLAACTATPPDHTEPQPIAAPITQPCSDIAKPGCEALENIREAAYKLQIHLDTTSTNQDVAHEIATLFCAADNLQLVCDTL